MTVEGAAPMTRDEAERATERIRLALDRVSTAWADLGERISEAYQRRADLALGYDSWAEYAEAELRPTEGLAVEIRRQLVGMLTAEGMSTRAIAPTVGVSDATAWRDSQVLHDEAPDPEHTDDTEVIDPETGEVHETPEAWAEAARTSTSTPPPAPPPPTSTIGLDGKRYKRPTPTPATESAPKRRPLTDQAHDAATNLTAAVEKLARIFEDDRLAANRKQVGEITRAHLLRTIEVCQDLANQL